MLIPDENVFESWGAGGWHGPNALMQKKGKGAGWSVYVLELMFISFRSIQDRFWLEKGFVRSV